MTLVERAGDFTFNPPINCQITRESDGMLMLCCDEAELYATGTDMETLMNDLKEEVAFAWQEYAERPVDNLHSSAKKYRAWLLEHVSR